MQVPIPECLVDAGLFYGTRFSTDNDREIMDAYIKECAVFPSMSGHTFEWKYADLSGYITGENQKEALAFLSADLNTKVPSSALRLLSTDERRKLNQGMNI